MASASQSIVNSIVERVLVSGLKDWVQASEVASISLVHSGIEDPASIRWLSLQAIRHALNGSLMTVGDLNSREFMRWETSVEESLSRIENLWPLDRIPDLGEVCWLSNTEHGDELAKAAASRLTRNAS